MPPSPHGSVALSGPAGQHSSVISFLKSAIHSFTRVCGKHLLCARQCLHSTIAFQLNCGVFNSSQSCTQNSGPLPPRAFPLLFSPARSHLDPAPTHCFAHSNTAYPCPFLAEKSLGFLEFMQSFFSFLLRDVFNALSYCDVSEACGHEILMLSILQQVFNQCINKLIPAGL